MGTAQATPLKARFNEGRRDYIIGNHPLWQLFRVAYQSMKKPFVARGLALGAGFLWAALRRIERPVSSEFIAFRRREEIERLARVLTGRKQPAAASVPSRAATNESR